MRLQVIDVQHPLLRPFIQSFLFFSADNGCQATYSTFPNTNLCLAIYLQNNVSYIRDDKHNFCYITAGGPTYTSRIYGFHNQPFSAKIESSLDQVCILFHPGALRAFTKIPYEELIDSDSAFDQIFSYSDRIWLERIFGESKCINRAQILESLLLNSLTPVRSNSTVLTALAAMNRPTMDTLRIDDISQRCNVNASTLYRLFLADVGQSPKSFLQTIRFRSVLPYLLSRQNGSLTHIAHAGSFYDQSHFNRQIRKLSGHNPHQLRKMTKLEPGGLAWIPQ